LTARIVAAPLAIALLAFAAAPGAAQIGINGTSQAASTGEVEITFNALSRCRRNRQAIAMAGSGARAVERERLLMDYRRLRYAGSGLTEAEAALLDARERRLEAEAGRAWRTPSYTSGARRRHPGVRSHRGC
jgi:hypothetical protein